MFDQFDAENQDIEIKNQYSGNQETTTNSYFGNNINIDDNCIFSRFDNEMSDEENFIIRSNTEIEEEKIESSLNNRMKNLSLNKETNGEKSGK